ncbi:MAG: glutathione transferase GstA [Burkholderiaceae bacterium]|nr:glutathione transferase GstA [Burkholderiaceae bacterium]
MKLYFSPGACSLVPHIVVRETAAQVDLLKVDLKQHRTEAGDDYYAINPKGQVPLLVLDDGSTLSEGPVIAQYIADQAKATTLAPAAGSMARYRVMEWQNYITSELHKSFSPLFKPDTPDSVKATALTVLTKKFEWVDGQLAGREYLTGADFTIADAYLFVVAAWAKKVGPSLDHLAHLQAFLVRVAARPAVQAALNAEGLA